MSACCMCVGTDCAGDCAAGMCRWEWEEQRRMEEQAQEDAYWQQLYEDGLAAAQIVGELARPSA